MHLCIKDRDDGAKNFCAENAGRSFRSIHFVDFYEKSGVFSKKALLSSLFHGDRSHRGVFSYGFIGEIKLGGGRPPLYWEEMMIWEVSLLKMAIGASVPFAVWGALRWVEFFKRKPRYLSGVMGLAAIATYFLLAAYLK